MRICKNQFLRWAPTRRFVFSLGMLLALPASASPFAIRGRSDQEKVPTAAGMGFELNASEADVVPIVDGVAADPIVRGTYVYERQKILIGAKPASSSSYFGAWTGPGHVFYKVLTGALAPRHFKDSADLGTITVRYIVQARSDSRVHLWIFAVFVTEGSRKAAPSDGTVESSEFKEIQDRLQQIQVSNQETAALIEKRQEEDETRAAAIRDRQVETARLESAESSLKNLDSQWSDLRHKLIVKVAGGNAELKSAPFHSSTGVQTLTAGEELVVLIVTPAWLGVEAPDKHRGWLRHDQVEPLP
jgi:hypothetical protein